MSERNTQNHTHYITRIYELLRGVVFPTRLDGTRAGNTAKMEKCFTKSHHFLNVSFTPANSYTLIADHNIKHISAYAH